MRVDLVARTTLAVALALSACKPVRLVGAYDDILDRDMTDLHTKIVSFVGRMETLSGKPEGTYDANATFYSDVKGSIASLELRARLQEKNEVTVKLLDELAHDMDNLRTLHEMGKEKGLNKAVAEPAVAAIEENCQGVMKLEVAKKREGQ
jgi:hypothetical protein